MADLSLEGYLTKKQAEKKCGRHRRTISSDITGALARGDQELLALCRVRTKQDVVREGTELSPKEVSEMVKRGDNPTWYCLPQFVELVKQRKSGPRSDIEEDVNEDTTTSADNSRERDSKADTGGRSDAGYPQLPRLPKDPSERAAILESLYRNSLQDLQGERNRNDKIFALIETIPKQQEQTNVLLREFQELMKSSSASLALPANQGKFHHDRSQVVETDTMEAQTVVDTEIAVLAKSPTRPKNKTTAKKMKKKPTKKANKSFTKKHLPTISSWFGQ